MFGIKTIYLPAIEIKVLSAAPFCPLSSFNTCIKNYLIRFYNFLYLISFRSKSYFRFFTTKEMRRFFFVFINLITSFNWSISFIDSSSGHLLSNSDSGFTSTGSLTSRLPSLIFFCSSFSLSFNNFFS